MQGMTTAATRGQHRTRSIEQQFTLQTCRGDEADMLIPAVNVDGRATADGRERTRLCLIDVGQGAFSAGSSIHIG